MDQSTFDHYCGERLRGEEYISTPVFAHYYFLQLIVFHVQK